MPLTAPPKAVHDPFKSGWDDTLKSVESLKKQTSFKPKAKVSPLRIPPPTLRLPSPTYSDSSADEEGDASFAASTQNYLLSPTGKEALGRAGMVILSPMSHSAEDLDIHAESQQLIRKPNVSKVESLRIDRHLRAPSHGFPATPEMSPTIPTFAPIPVPTRPAPQNPFLAEIRVQPPAESPAERVVRPSKSRENLSISAWPQPPTSIPSSPSPSPTRSPSRGTATPSPTLFPPTSTPMGNAGDAYYDYVRQSSPTFQKATLTNRDRAYMFGAPTPTVTPPSRVSPPSQGTPVNAMPELKEVPRGKVPALGPVKSSLKRWESRSSQMSLSSAIGGDANGIVDVTATSPSVSSFIISPSIYSTHLGSQNHATGMVHLSVVNETA